MPVIRNEDAASHGKATLVFFHPPNVNCKAVKASPTILASSPQVHRTGSKSDDAPRLKITALKNMNETN